MNRPHRGADVRNGWPVCRAPRTSCTMLYQPASFDRRTDEGGEQRVRCEGPRFQLGMELHADEPRVVFIFDDFRKNAVRRHPGKPHAVLLETSLVGRVHFIAMAMSFGAFRRDVDL